MVYPMFATTQGVTEHAPLCELETAEKIFAFNRFFYLSSSTRHNEFSVI